MTHARTPQVGRRYPVISVSLEAAEEAVARQGRSFSFNDQALEALAAINKRKRKPAEVSIWVRAPRDLERPFYAIVNTQSPEACTRRGRT